MHIYIELWNARPEWLQLSQEERGNYVNQLGPAIGELLGNGIELVGFALNDSDVPYRAEYHYIAVWKMPNVELVHKLEEAVQQAGWHNYFEQVNARGAIVSPEQALGDMVSL